MMPISLSFHWVTLAIKQTTRQPSIAFVIEDHWRKIPKNGYLCMLIDSKVYSIVTYFWKTNSMAIVTTGAGAVVTKTTISILCNRCELHLLFSRLNTPKVWPYMFMWREIWISLISCNFTPFFRLRWSFHYKYSFCVEKMPVTFWTPLFNFFFKNVVT